MRAGAEHETRNAVVLGVALGVGAFAKSFMVPWAAVCLFVLAVATRSRGIRASLIAGVVWAVIVAPWAAVLTHRAGRFTFGDTGRLTYAWYVNKQDAPSAGGVPLGARTAATETILTGTGATGPAPGTDPMWFDPARWNAMVAPHWNLEQQMDTFKAFQLFYVQSLTPLLFLILLVVTAPRGTRRHAWWNGWVVYVPAVAGIVAYSLVLVTARYVMPFLLAGMLTLLATLPRPRRMLPLMAMLGIAIPIGLESTSNDTVFGLALVAAAVAAMTIGALVPTRSRLVWGLVVFVGICARPDSPSTVHAGRRSPRSGAHRRALLAHGAFRHSRRAPDPVRAASHRGVGARAHDGVGATARAEAETGRQRAEPSCVDRVGECSAQDRPGLGGSRHWRGNADRVDRSARRVVLGAHGPSQDRRERSENTRLGLLAAVARVPRLTAPGIRRRGCDRRGRVDGPRRRVPR